MKRTWGMEGFAYRDGPNWQPERYAAKDHVIVDSSYSEGFISCSCGRTTLADGFPLADVWAVHVGREYKPAAYKKAQLASDSDVQEFLGQLANPFYTAPVLKNQSYTPRISDRERARDAMFTIVEMGLRCTCTGNKPSRDCPNFIDGDDK